MHKVSAFPQRLPSRKLPLEDSLMLGGVDGAAARRLPCGKPPVQTLEPARLFLPLKAVGGGLLSSKAQPLHGRATEASQNFDDGGCGTAASN